MARRRFDLKVRLLILRLPFGSSVPSTFVKRRRTISAFGHRQAAATRTGPAGRHENPWPPFGTSIAIQEQNGLDSRNEGVHNDKTVILFGNQVQHNDEANSFVCGEGRANGWRSQW
jgi:hypothetical protein